MGDGGFVIFCGGNEGSIGRGMVAGEGDFWQWEDGTRGGDGWGSCGREDRRGLGLASAGGAADGGRERHGFLHGRGHGRGMGAGLRGDRRGWLVGEELDQDDYDGKDADDGAQAGEGARFGFGHLGAKGVDGFGGVLAKGVDGFGGFDPVVFHFLAQIPNVLSRVASKSGELATEMGHGVVEVSLGSELLGLAFGRR